MASMMESLGIDRMSRDERLALVEAIWNSIAAESKPLLREAQRDELERRRMEDEQTPDDVVPWDEAKTRILGSLKK